MEPEYGHTLFQLYGFSGVKTPIKAKDIQTATQTTSEVRVLIFSYEVLPSAKASHSFAMDRASYLFSLLDKGALQKEDAM